MRALEKSKPGPGLWLVDVPVPEPGPGQVQFKVSGSSICGTDLHIYNWDPWAQGRIKPPLIIGHEACGEVTAVGAGVTSVQEGNFIAAESHFPCTHCRLCRTGNMHLCLDMHIFGFDAPGAFAEYAVIPEVCAWKVTDEIDRNYASLLEPLGNAVHVTLVEDVAGKSVAIYGCGPVGLFSTAIAKSCEASEIIAVEPNRVRQRLAKKAGATRVIDPTKETASDAILEETGGLGADVVLELSGNDRAIADSFHALRRAGRYCFFGFPKGEVTLDITNHIIFKGARIYGITGRKMFDTWMVMAGLLRAGLDIRPLVTHKVPFLKYKKAFELMESGECGKVMLRV